MSDWQCLPCGAWNNEHIDGICWRCNGDRRPTKVEERRMTTKFQELRDKMSPEQREQAAAVTQSIAHRSDKEKLISAIMELRALGYWAREAQRDGAKAVPEDVLKRGGKWVVTDERENGKFNVDGNLGGLVDLTHGVPKDCTLHVHHQSRDAAEIVTVLRQHGLDAAIVNEGDCDEVVIYPTLV